MKILCVIPSRIGSTRLARKPLLPIQGKPMIQHVYENARKCALLTEVLVATDSEEIFDLIQSQGGKAIMTDSAIPSGSHRTAIIAEHFPDMNVIINLQGDEPFMKPKMLEALVSSYLQGDMPEMTTLACPLLPEDLNNPSIVKVVTDQHHNALYFSRAPIPYFRETIQEVPAYHHLGVYAFRKDFLKIYCELPETPLGKAENLEQLRVLEHGYKIKVNLTHEKTMEINTQEEWEKAQYFQN
ncbi:MAG: 3-deoxy-D-manno-octulosonate cytidylyltransferase [Gammaproteobacteria bacterium RIFCSPLOWO2_02_FULL_38_11]|nr:MAG: 3-deoxy-D-manno-octulosonate cytidylyltransferase [Gammaproteobacteria bacterium RIFCSPHIGHO2_02_FULL_38_33]OGT24583.1 MAG: 3-deoxy-D-manno-octulosonate cytidylyltransferase [Gammaproteobacteria bacterium RIFCSPHIGHO2_12_38_15]OGT69039.1 MAG: 3-deoxy-D-manno-octulosonate cytidylyltransferase [Gammaproteobacteria bacterium RIFCSPLOWO2_02_FULL_38_11]OGT75630.1 MAG: 3-deoxy-D-manno-octulosonate cytidylyltransferase [Gammaproteobacteria bacterium RIFCSPLOWO2_12_FULL_38_14]